MKIFTSRLLLAFLLLLTVSFKVMAVSAPTNLVATQNQVGRIDLSWTASNGATSYNVYRSPSGGGAYTVIGSPTGTNYSDTAVTTGVAYYYKVSPVVNGAEVTGSPVFTSSSFTLAGNASISGTTATKTSAGAGWDTQAYSTNSLASSVGVIFQVTGSSPNVMAGLSSHPTTNKSYDPIDFALYSSKFNNAVQIYESGTAVYSGAPPAAGDVFEVGYDGSTVTYKRNGSVIRTVQTTAGRIFYFDSSMYNTGDAVTNIQFGSYTAGSLTTSVVSGVAVLTAPTNMSATTNAVGKVDLVWAALSGASSYKVYRSTSSDGPYSVIGSPSSNGYSDISVVAGTTYWYRITAVSGTSESSQSAIVSGYSIPTTVTGLAVSNTQVGSVNLSWTTVSGATYKVYRSTDNVSYAVVAMPSGTSYSDSSVAAGATYYYKVAAIINGAEGSMSAFATGSAVSPVPAGLSATQGTVTGKVDLSWTAINGVSRYGVYRDGVQLGFVTTAFYDDALNEVSVHSYTVTAVNGSSESAPSSAVTGYANLAPTSITGSGTTKTDELVTITPIISDPNSNDEFTLSIAAMPAHGGVSLQNGSFVYQSIANWSGVDGFDVTVTDKAGASVGGHITVAVNGLKTPTPYRFILKNQSQ